MVLRLTLPLALVVAGSSCKQSLFDEHVDDTDGPPTPPGGDGGGGGGDGGGGGTCPAPCVGNAVLDFDNGTQDGPWYYFEDDRAAQGITYPQMTWGTFGTGMAWVGTGDPAPAIVGCSGQGPGECTGNADRYLMVPSDESAAHNDPTIAFQVSETGVYRITGDYRLGDVAMTGTEQRLILSRNFRNDSMWVQSFTPSADLAPFDVQVELFAGERFLMELRPIDPGTASPVSFTTYVSGPTPIADSTCQVALTFDGTMPLVDRCRGITIDDGCASYMATTEITSVSTQFSNARHIANDQCMEIPVAMDYSGDFTIEFWLKIEDEDPGPAVSWPWSVVFNDQECDPANGGPGGVHIWTQSGQLGMGACGPGDDCSSCRNIAAISHPTDEGWHFYRLVRDTTAGALRFCLDGEMRGMATAQDGDFSSNELPHIGNMYGNIPYFTGAIDELRIYKRALPCPN